MGVKRGQKKPDKKMAVPFSCREAWHAVPAICKYPDPCLRRKAEPVPDPTGEAVVDLSHRLAQVLETCGGGLGLAAPQIGVSLAVMLTPINGTLEAVVNPRLLLADQKTATVVEGCLSLPQLRAPVTRPQMIVVTYQSAGKPGWQEVMLGGEEARVFQHEYDHLQGVLFLDHAPQSTWFWMSPEGVYQPYL